jgi:hypothetical protein
VICDSFSLSDASFSVSIFHQLPFGRNLPDRFSVLVTTVVLSFNNRNGSIEVDFRAFDGARESSPTAGNPTFLILTSGTSTSILEPRRVRSALKPILDFWLDFRFS